MKIQSNILLSIAVFLQISSYFMPFLSQKNGWGFFEMGIKALASEGIQGSNWYMFYAFFSPLLSFPVLLAAMSKYAVNRKLSFLKIVLFFFLFCPVVLSLGLVLIRQGLYREKTLLGYLAWSMSFMLMYSVFFFKGNEKGENSGNDLMEHLIEEE